MNESEFLNRRALEAVLASPTSTDAEKLASRALLNAQGRDERREKVTVPIQPIRPAVQPQAVPVADKSASTSETPASVATSSNAPSVDTEERPHSTVDDSEPPLATTAEEIDELLAQARHLKQKLLEHYTAFVTTISRDVGRQIDLLLRQFQKVASKLQVAAPNELAAITRGFEELLFAEPTPVSQSEQRLVGQQFERLTAVQDFLDSHPQYRQRKKKKLSFGDGLDSFV